ncbi:MAG: META domain-containing protein [Bifidobacteriaceae bacterium]|jgi:heat shock protein HslJ|nr:META domain-containing protein [Bifidobacteriaceae bacterium]
MTTLIGAGRKAGRRGVIISAVAVAVIIALAVGLRALRAEPPPERTEASQSRDLNRLRGDWTLARLQSEGQDVQSERLSEVTLTLGRTSADGWTGCQAYATIYQASQWGVFKTDPLGTTEGTCQGEDAEFAQSYLDAFTAASRWSLTDDGGLQLRGGRVTLTYTRGTEQPTPGAIVEESAWAGTWRVVRLETTEHQVEVNQDAGLWIGIGGRRSIGYGGCNAFFGRVTTLGARGLFFDRLVLGLKTCTGSDTVMRLESDLMDALTRVDRWDMDEEGNLVLMGGGESVTLERTGPPPAIDTPPPI